MSKMVTILSERMSIHVRALVYISHYYNLCIGRGIAARTTSAAAGTCLLTTCPYYHSDLNLHATLNIHSCFKYTPCYVKYLSRIIHPHLSHSPRLTHNTHISAINI